MWPTRTPRIRLVFCWWFVQLHSHTLAVTFQLIRMLTSREAEIDTELQWQQVRSCWVKKKFFNYGIVCPQKGTVCLIVFLSAIRGANVLKRQRKGSKSDFLHICRDHFHAVRPQLNQSGLKSRPCITNIVLKATMSSPSTTSLKLTTWWRCVYNCLGECSQHILLIHFQNLPSGLFSHPAFKLSTKSYSAVRDPNWKSSVRILIAY